MAKVYKLQPVAKTQNKKKQRKRAPRKGPKRQPTKLQYKPNARKRNTAGIKSMRKRVPAADAAMIRNFLAPCDAHGFRWPISDEGQPSATKTGSVTLFNTSQFINSHGFTGTYCGGDSNARGTQAMFLFRNPLRAAVVLTTVATASTYNIKMANGSYTFALTPSQANYDPPFAYASAANPLNAPHTTELFGGGLSSCPEMQFFWLGVNDRFDFYVKGTGTPADFVSIYKVVSPGSRDAQRVLVKTLDEITGVSNTVPHSFTVTDPYTQGYYGVIVSTLATAITWTYTVNLVVAVGDAFAHLPVPRVLEHASYFRNIRLLSSSLLASNVSSYTDVEGTIYGAVVSDGTPFYEHTLPSNLSSLADHYNGKAKDGIYTWLRPGGQGVFNYRKAVQLEDDIVADTTFALDDGSSYQAVVVFTGGRGDSFPALDFMVAMSFTLEFLSDDPWVQLEYPNMSLNEANACLEAAIRSNSFSENPLHLAQIRQFIGGAGKFLRGHSNAIGTILSRLFPAYSVPIRAIAGFAQS